MSNYDESRNFVPLTRFDQEFAALMSFSKDRCLKNILLELTGNHPELTDEVKQLLRDSAANKAADHIYRLIYEAHFQGFPEHYTMKDFDMECMSESDATLLHETRSLRFLSTSRQNLTLFGPPGFGKEKVASGLGDLLCRAGYTVQYIDFHDLMETIRTRGTVPTSHTYYTVLAKTNVLIIDDFAGKKPYDPDLIDGLYILKNRSDAHLKSFVAHKRNPKGHIRPFSTIITTCHAPTRWTGRMSGEDAMTTLKIDNLLYGKGVMITVDETNPHPTSSELF